MPYANPSFQEHPVIRELKHQHTKKRQSVPLICILPVPFWLLAALADNEVIASFAALIGIYFGAGWLKSIFKQPALMLSYLKIGGVSMLVMMSLSWLIAQFFNLTTLNQTLSTALVKDVYTTLPDYAIATAYTLVFAAVLGSLGSLKFIKILEAHAVKRLLVVGCVRHRKLLSLIVVICCLEVWLIVNGIISYRTFAIEGYDEGNIVWYLPILQIFFATQVGLNALAISQIVKGATTHRKLSIIIVVASILLILFITFTQGRAGFIFCALLHIYWVIFFIERMPKFRRIIPFIIIALPILYSGALLSNFLRSGATDGIDLEKVGIISYLDSALQIWQADQVLQSLEKTRSAENLASRPLVAHPLAKSIALPYDKKRFLLGENIFNSAIWAIPSAFISDKNRYPKQEDLLYANFPVGTTDTADSPYLYAYVDFGYIGLVIYPALLATIWLTVLLLIRLPYISSLGILVCATVWISMFTLSLGEVSMVSWFSLIRNTVISLPFAIILSKLFSFPSPAAKSCMYLVDNDQLERAVH